MESLSRKPILPVDATLPQILDFLKHRSNLVIEAPAGAGKTTRVPPALLGTVSGEVIVLEPRRIAARLAARRVAWEMGEELGETVGYRVRFEEVAGPRHAIAFCHRGRADQATAFRPISEGCGCGHLDEFHERHLEGDLALALLRRLQRTRPELRIVVMSATLDSAPVAQFLGDCPVVRSEARLFELSIKHLPYSPQKVEVQVKNAVELLLEDKHTGDVLTFLPGAAEIRRAMRECAKVARSAGC